MRYDKPIYFVTEGEEVYGYDTGNYVTGEPIKDEVWANISDMRTERQTLVFGGLKQGALTIRIRGQYEKEFDYIEYDDTPYNIASTRSFRHDQAFEVGERL